MRALAYLRRGDRVLEVGCSSGALTEHIAAMGCRVTGIEVRPDAADRARRFAEDVLVGDLTTMPLALHLVDFDAIRLSDVLEPLVDPVGALRRLFPFLREGGRFVVAIPNVAHWFVRFHLLAGRFAYGDSGILDRTHLRFYTRDTARALLEQAGPEVDGRAVAPHVPLLCLKPRFVRASHPIAWVARARFRHRRRSRFDIHADELAAESQCPRD